MGVRAGRDPFRTLLLLTAAWALTRCALVVVSRARGLYAYQDDPYDIGGFAAWGAAFAGGPGAAPLRDGPWEYPAGAALVVVLPALLERGSYVLGFVAQMLLWDLALLLLLAAWGRRQGSSAGAWLWVAVVPLLGPVALTRYDLVPTVLAAGGMVAAAAAAPLTAGLLLASGGAIKLWPAALIPLVLLLPARRERWSARVLAGCAVPAVVTLAAVAAYRGLGQLLSFLTYQRDRGLEVESLLALPLMVARVRGAEGIAVSFAFGSYQVDGPGAGLLATLGTVGLVGVLLGVGALAWRARRRGASPLHALPVLTVVLLAGVLCFDKVISAQYPLWLAGAVAVALCTPRSPLRSTVAPLCGLLLLTQYVYPLAIQDLLAGASAPVLALLVRDALLVLVLAQAVSAALGLGSEDGLPGDEQQREHAEAGG